MSYETEPIQPLSQPDPLETPQLEAKRKSDIRAIAIVNPKDRVTLLDPELLTVGGIIEVTSEDSLSVRFITGEPNEEGKMPITRDYVDIKGQQDHVEISGGSTVLYRIAPVQNQGEFATYRTYSGVPGTKSVSLGERKELLSIEYKGSVVGDLIHEVLGDTEQASFEQLTEIEDFLKRSRGYYYEQSIPLAFGMPLEREVANVYDRQVVDTLEKQTGQKPTSFAADARFGVLYRRGGLGITGVLLTKDEDGINRLHEIGKFHEYKNSSSSKKKGKQTPYEEILARWLAVMESPQTRLDFDFINGSKHLYHDLFTVIHNRMRKLQGQDLTSMEKEGFDSLPLYGFNIDAQLPEARTDLIVQRLQQPAVQKLLK